MARIMIVDDAAEDCVPLERFLEKAGHSVIRQPNGREALATLITEKPDAVIMDLAMPEMDGPSFLEVVRSYLRLQSLPVVVLTGMTDGPFLDRIRTAKVSAILVKGKATPQEIRAAVEQALHTLHTLPSA